MATKAKPYERFGSYLLFKKIETDKLGDVWRAGEITGETLGATVALRRFPAGDRQATLQSFEAARAVAAAVSGTTFVKNQKLGISGDSAYLAFDYGGGRSLRHIMEKARGGNPVPIDQALSIVEKLALSLETLGNMRYQGARLIHGALIPNLVWVSEEGEVRCAGQQLGRALATLSAQPDVAREVTPFLAPEARGGEGSKAADVYSLGAILFTLVTANEPPLSGAAAAVASAKLMGRDDAVPADIRQLLEKSLAESPDARYPSATEMRAALDKLLAGNSYAPTTFNLAFYLHNLLKKEFESEALDREKEAGVSLAPYLHEAAAPVAAAVVPTASTTVPAPFSSYAAAPEKKSRMPLIAAAALLVVAAGAGGAWYFLKGKPKPAPASVTAAQMVTPKPAAPAPIEPIVVAVPVTDSAATTAAAPTLDEAARKKAIEDAVNKKLQEEMMKLQAEYDQQLKTQKPSAASAPQPRAETASVRPQPEERSPSAAQLDASRRQQEPVETAAAAPPTVQPQPAAPQPAAPLVQQVREGDLINLGELDQQPELRSQVRPVYPPMALRKKSEATVIVSVLITEEGRVADVKVLRGETGKLGFDEAAVRAVRSASFTPPVKQGKRVKTWKPLPIVFKLQ